MRTNIKLINKIQPKLLNKQFNKQFIHKHLSVPKLCIPSYFYFLFTFSKLFLHYFYFLMNSIYVCILEYVGSILSLKKHVCKNVFFKWKTIDYFFNSKSHKQS